MTRSKPQAAKQQHPHNNKTSTLMTPLYPRVTWPDEEYLDFIISVKQDEVTKYWYWEARGKDGTVLKGRMMRPDYAFITARTAINKRRPQSS